MTISRSIDCMERTIADLSRQPGFPHNYCNVASKQLLALLQEEGKDARLQFSYLEKGEGHAFVVEKLENGEEIILDPTYAQYDLNYHGKGFVGAHFPDKILEQNRSEAEQFLQEQRKWYADFDDDQQ